jgi:Fe-S oxidoreductase
MSTSAAVTPIFPTFEQVCQGFAGQIGMLRQMAPEPTLTDAVRVERAIDTLIAETNAGEAVWLESYPLRTVHHRLPFLPGDRRDQIRPHAQDGPVSAHLSTFGASADTLMNMINTIRDHYGVEIPLDKPSAEVMVLSSAVDLVANGNGLLATARIMNHLGVDWTMCSDGFESANFGLLSGDMALWRQQSASITAAAERIGAKTLVIAECGHAYPALRWNPMVKGGSLPFDMVYMSEFLGRMAKAGRLNLTPIDGKITYHDPCKTGRRGGAFDQPRAVLQAMNADYVELPSGREYNWCCGGGAGIFLLARATRLRDESFKIKIKQVNATGAATVVVSCASCRLNFEAGRVKNQWDKQVASLVELVADHLIDAPAPAGQTSPTGVPA